MSAIQKLIDLDKKNRLKIAVVGDAMRDIYIHGRLGMCQEESLKFIEERREEVPGGAWNAFRQLKNWNCLLALFSHQTSIKPVKTRFLVNGKFVFRHDLDEMDCETILADRRKIELAKLRVGAPHAILISDYDKGFLTPEFIREIIDLAAERKIPCVVDAKREPSLYEGAIIKCNAEYASKRIWRDNKSIVVTDGANPAKVLLGNGTSLVMAGRCYPKVPVVNHVGAGDCFAAHLVLGLAHGLSLVESAEIAHSAGRRYVQHEHNRPPTPEEIRRDMEELGGCGVKFHRVDCKCQF